LSASIARSDSSTSSREVTSPARTSSACSVAGRVRYSVAMAEEGTLAPNGVTRIRADNPSPLTLDGTNTYVAGRWVIDPGPDDPDHLDAVAAHGPFDGIVLTHSHYDHAEGAPSLAARAGLEVVAPGGGERVGPFEVIATPGHSPDSVALLFGRVLFAGDTVLGTGSVFVGGEEGSMAAYLDSLRRLLELDLDAICPGHGPVIWEPRAKLEEYLSHRLERERLVVEALSAGAQTRDEVLDRAWSDVDFEAAPYLRFAAGLTLDAHLDKLSAEGRLRDEISRLR
jgi:glyoxylase-like metal-dependent hydrolase (beta-lactamase superfamily II)